MPTNTTPFTFNIEDDINATEGRICMLKDIPYSVLKKNRRAYEIMLLRDQYENTFTDNVSQERLRHEQTIPTSFGQTLSWKYWEYATENPDLLV